MALLPGERELRKEAVKRRLTAHHARVREFRAAEAAATVPIRNEMQPQIDKVSEERENLLFAWQKEDAAIRAQIAALEQKLRDLSEKRAEEDAPLKEASHALYAQLHSRLSAAERLVLEQFPDMAGNAQFYVGEWKPLEDFL